MVQPIDSSRSMPALAPSTPAAPPAAPRNHGWLGRRAVLAVAVTAMLVLTASAPLSAQAGGSGSNHTYGAANGVPMTPVTAGGACTEGSGLITRDGVQYSVSSRQYGGETAEARVYADRNFSGVTHPDTPPPRLTAEADVGQRTVTFTIPGIGQNDRPRSVAIVPVGDQLAVDHRDEGFEVGSSADSRTLTVTGNGVRNTVVMGEHGGDRIDTFVNQQPGAKPYQDGQSILEMPSGGSGQALVHIASTDRQGSFHTLTSGCERPTGGHACPTGYGSYGQNSGLITRDEVQYSVDHDGYSESAEARVFANAQAAGYNSGSQPLLNVKGSVASREIEFVIPGNDQKEPRYLNVTFAGGELHADNLDEAAFQVRASGDNRTLTVVGNGVQSTVAVSDDGDKRLDVYVNQHAAPPKYQAGESIMEVPTGLTGPVVFRVAGGDDRAAGFSTIDSGCKAS